MSEPMMLLHRLVERALSGPFPHHPKALLDCCSAHAARTRPDPKFLEKSTLIEFQVFLSPFKENWARPSEPSPDEQNLESGVCIFACETLSPLESETRRLTYSGTPLHETSYWEGGCMSPIAFKTSQTQRPESIM